MKSTDTKLCGNNCLSCGQANWLLLCGMLMAALACVQPVSAADDLYQNDGVVTYPGTESSLPQIDATNFVNNGTFIVNHASLTTTPVQPFYETSDTLNYVNTGLMMANTGFQFDTRSSANGLRSMAGSYYNTGLVSCGSTNNLTDPYFGQVFLYNYFLGSYSFYPQCLVNATNIVTPGGMELGFGGMGRFTGQNIDLRRTSIGVEQSPAVSFFVSGLFGTTSVFYNASVAGTGTFGLNTNYWNPFAYLTATTAQSAYFPLTPFYLYLTNSTPYINVAGDGSNNVIRAVFIQEDSGPKVAYNVYFFTAGIGLGNGTVTIEWDGSYLDPASGATAHNYLYLNNNYIRSTDTNLFLYNGVPDNFQFTQSSTQIPTGVAPAPAGFNNVFSNVTVTNRYAFVNAQLTPSSVDLNSVANHALTNLPGRVEINASEVLDMTDAQLTGLNYLNIQSPKQFNGTAGALIQSAYSDFNLGVTNGFLAITNLVSPGLPSWGGKVQAWSTRWLEASASGGTNDFRVLIIGSQLTPTALAQIQDMVLHGTNSITISDTLNITRKFTADAENLTLTTNEIGAGATSLAGELNIASTNIFYGTNALPNVRNLTNNGAIRVPNLVRYSGITNTMVMVPATGQTTASAELHEVLLGRKNLENKSTVQIGTNVYSFVKFLKKKVPNQVKIARTFDGTLNNLIAAINGAPGAGKLYSPVTPPNPLVTAGALTGPVTNRFFTVTAKIAGDYGNAIVARTTSANLIWQNVAGYSNWTTLAGGAEPMPATTNAASALVPYRNFINRGLMTAQGMTVWTTNFFSCGMISNGPNASFSLDTVAAVMTNASILAGGDVTINSGSLLASNVVIQAGRSLVLSVTNSLDDGGVTNGSIWVVQSPAGFGGNGLIQRIKPPVGDLLGTTVTNFAAAPNKQTLNVWAGQNHGVSNAGYTNNCAIGRLNLSVGAAASVFRFTGASVSNALYVDCLELGGYATNFDGDINSLKTFLNSQLIIDPNMTIYFAQALLKGDSVAEKLDGANGGRLRWISSYAGYFSSTNLIYGGYTNTVNTALAISSSIDSDGDGIPNASDPTPFPVPAPAPVVTLKLDGVSPPMTGAAAKSAVAPQQFVCLQWVATGGETYSLYYRTDLLAGDWMPYTSFAGYYYGNGIWVPNTAQNNSIALPADAGSAVTVRVVDGLTSAPQFYYQVRKP